MLLDQHNLAEHAYTAVSVFVTYLYHFVRAETHIKPDESSAVIKFLKFYRPGAVVFSIVLSCLAFHYSAIGIGLAMIRSPNTGSPSGSIDKTVGASQDHGPDEDNFTKTKADSSEEALSPPPSPPTNLFALHWPTTTWRSPTLRLCYHAMLWTTVLGIDSTLGLQSIASRSVLFMLSSALISPLRMLWTQSIIAPSPDDLSLHRARWAWCQSNPLFVPALVYSGVQALAIATPIVIIVNISTMSLHWDMASVMHVLTVPGTTAALVVCLLLPTATALARVEAALLPADRESLIPCNRTFVNASASTDQSLYAEYLQPFLSALRSVDIKTLRQVLKQVCWWTIAFIAATTVHHS